MSRQVANPIAYCVGIMAMLAAVFMVTVTFATNDYGAILRWILALSCIAALSFGYVVFAGPNRWRIIAIISSLALIYVVSEVARRGIE